MYIIKSHTLDHGVFHIKSFASWPIAVASRRAVLQLQASIVLDGGAITEVHGQAAFPSAADERRRCHWWS